MDAARQAEATKRAARAQLRRTVRDELAGRDDATTRRRRSAALLQRVRTATKRTTHEQPGG